MSMGRLLGEQTLEMEMSVQKVSWDIGAND